MNLIKLFDMQRELDAKIIKEKGLENMDRLPYLILALQVELGECANEWRGFKYWSKDRKARGEMKVQCPKCHGEGTHGALGESLGYMEVDCTECDENCEVTINPLLEEYVDCLHFILSIGLHLGIEESVYQNLHEELTGTIEAFQHAFNWIVNLEHYRKISAKGTRMSYENLVSVFIALGFFLGFTWEQIEQAYMDKNAVNHNRQSNGY